MSKITGTVIDYATDDPLLGVLVQGVAKNGQVFASTTTDSQGGFTLDNTGFDDLYSSISFMKDGYVGQTMRPASANNATVVLPRVNTLAAVTLTLKRSPTKALLFIAIGIAVAYFAYKYRNHFKL